MDFSKFGVILFAGMIAFSLVDYVQKTTDIRTDIKFLKHASSLSFQTIPTLEENQRVLITGVITKNNPRLYLDLVLGVKEHDMGEDGWEIEQDPEVQINLEIEKGKTIPLFVDQPYPRGNDVSIDMGYAYRWRGYTVNTFLCSLATVQKEPLLFYGEKHFAGTPQEYLKSLQGRLLAHQIQAGITLAGLSFFLIYFLKQAMEDDSFPDYSHNGQDQLP